MDQSGQFDQHLITETVAMGVVDLLEMVHVEQHDADRKIAAPRQVQQAAQLLTQDAAVVQAGQRVAHGLLA